MRRRQFIRLLLASVVVEVVLILIFYKKRPNFLRTAKAGNNKQNDLRGLFEYYCHDDASSMAQTRNFQEDPIRIGGAQASKSIDINDCPVKCIHYPEEDRLSMQEKSLYFDASIVNLARPRHNKQYMGLSVIRTMESVASLPESNLDEARQNYDIVMTPRLDSDIPMPYFSWEMFDFMKPPISPKPTSGHALATAFISNCRDRNGRLAAMRSLSETKSIPPLVDCFGKCCQSIISISEKEKLELLGNYKFHLAFENTNELDFVTDSFFQSLVEGTVPVVIGAPNIRNFAPSNNSILVIDNDFYDVRSVGRRMIQLGANDTEYNKMLLWKKSGPSHDFKALIDLAIVHSSCRLCITVADKIRAKESIAAGDHHCFCAESSIFRFFLRERGRFQFFEAFLTTKEANLDGLTEAVMTVFTSSSLQDGYEPLWARHRDENGIRRRRSNDENVKPAPLRLFRIYEVGGSTQGAVLFGDGAIDSDEKVKELFNDKKHKNRPCVRLEAIFV